MARWEDDEAGSRGARPPSRFVPRWSRARRLGRAREDRDEDRSGLARAREAAGADGTGTWVIPGWLPSGRESGRERPASAREGARRGVNVAAALLLLLLAAPLMLLIAAAIKLTSPGPVLFTQSRVGIDRRRGRPPGIYAGRRKKDYGGRLFTIYKFRTMEHCCERRNGQVWAREDDPRVTRLGRLLRKARLDELPQLWNVLRGDMNLVGPRPEQPEIFVELRKEIERYPARQQVRPGITGWAQVNHHYDRSIDDVRKKVAYDLEYIHRRSASEDLRIMLRTVPVMLLRKGAW